MINEVDGLLSDKLLGSTNAQVQHWGPARVAGIMHDLEGYLAGETLVDV